MFLRLSYYNKSFLTFFLDKKSNKKVKANTNAPWVLPGQRTRRA
jgi:hypothetical protein